MERLTAEESRAIARRCREIADYLEATGRLQSALDYRARAAAAEARADALNAAAQTRTQHRR